MSKARSSFEIVTLKDGRFMVMGGYDKNGINNECEIFDPSSSTWSSTANMVTPRHAFASCRLSDGRVYVTGGLAVLGTDMVTTSELFDISTNSWRETTPSLDRREGSDVILLSDGTVLLTAGDDAPFGNYHSSCEIFDPVTESYRFTDSIRNKQFATNTFYYPQRNSIIKLSGHCRVNAFKETEEYNISTGKWSVIGNTQTPHSCWQQQSLQLPDGRIIAVSGADGEKALSNLVEEFTPATNTWRTVCTLPMPRALATTVHISGDTILVIGGVDFNYTGMRNTTFIDLAKGTTWDGPLLNVGRGFHRAATIHKADTENPCREYVTVYVFGGYSQYPDSHTSCENITFSVSKPQTFSLPETLKLVGSECAGIDTVLWIKNASCRDMKIDSITTNGIGSTSISATALSIPIGDSVSLIISNSGDSVGNSSGEVIIYYTVNGKLASKTIYVSTSISGQGAKLVAPTSVSSIGTVCSGIDTTIILINRSCKDMILDSLSVLGIGASISGIALPTTIAPGDSIRYSVFITSEFPGNMNGAILVYSHTVDTSLVTRTDLSAQFSASVKGKIRSIIADRFNVGDSVIIPIYLNSNNGETVEGFSLTIEYDTDLLEPYTPDFTNTLVQGTGLYDQNATSTGLTLYVPTPFSISTSKPLVQLRFKTYVTDTTCAVIKLTKMILSPDNPTANYCLYQVISDSAVICLEKHCGDDLLRSQLRQTPLELRISHSIGSKSIVVYHNLVESGTITVYDALGRTVFDQYVQHNATNTTIDVRSFPSGLYIVALSSPIGRVQKHIALDR